MRMILNESDYLSLQDSESPQRAALEAALVEEYLQALNSSRSDTRRKRQIQPLVTATASKLKYKINEISFFDTFELALTF